MRNIINTNDRDRILTRIAALHGNERAQWGTMTASQMICHLTDQIRMALGDITVEDRSNPITRTVLAQIVLLGLPTPKGKIKTSPEIDVAKGQGTQPTTFEHDIDTLKKKIAEFLATNADFVFQSNSIFGPLTRRQWGRLIYLHLSYHLQQFGS